MGERPQEVLSLELRCDHDAPATVRAELGRDERLGWIMGDVMLVASELVANAVRHSGCAPDDVLSVTATMSQGSVRIVVADPGRSGGSAERRDLTDCSDAGIGLLIVDQLVDRWGAERDGGYLVWAELALGRAGALHGLAG